MRASKQQQEADGALPGPHMQWGSWGSGFSRTWRGRRRLWACMPPECGLIALHQHHCGCAECAPRPVLLRSVLLRIRPSCMLAGPLREVPGSTGMLVVESVVPGGPADGQVGSRFFHGVKPSHCCAVKCCAVRPCTLMGPCTLCLPCPAFPDHPLLVPCRARPDHAHAMPCRAMPRPAHTLPHHGSDPAYAMSHHAPCNVHAMPMPCPCPCPSPVQLEPGDVLVKLNGQIVTEFLTMEDLLDSSGECLACGCTAKHHMWRASPHCTWR